jgi:hypothetical protein
VTPESLTPVLSDHPLLGIQRSYALLNCGGREREERTEDGRAATSETPLRWESAPAAHHYIICHIWCLIIQLRIWLLGGGGRFAFVRLNSTLRPDQCVKLHDFLSANVG